MATWRQLRYVADSDEEEELQHSINAEAVDAAVAFAGHDDTQNSHSQVGLGAGIDAQEAGPEAIGISESVDEDTDFGRTIVASIDSLQQPGSVDEPRNSSIGKALDEERSWLTEDGGIDELQQDHFPNKPAVQLEVELLLGAEELTTSPRRNRLSPSPPKPIFSSQSSSLSSISHESARTSFIADDAGYGIDEQGPNNDPRRRETSPQTRSEQPVESSHNIDVDRTSRALRQRNPIQLHPYAIEIEKYRRFIKSRGLKPVRMAQVDAGDTRTRTTTSQDLDDHGDDQMSDSSSGSIESNSSPPAAALIPTEVPNNGNDIYTFGNDELPDVTPVLNNTSRKYIGSGQKRRRVGSTSFRMPQDMIREVHRNPQGQLPNYLAENDENVYDEPLSPPRSGNQSPIVTAQVVVPQRQPSPERLKTSLPTPLTSSEPRKSHCLVPMNEFSDEAPIDPAGSATSSVTSDSDEDSSADQEPSQFERVQRKIRGVLPASWLKIDLKSQKNNLSHDHQVRRETFRGVARPVNISKGMKSPSPALDMLASFSDSENSSPDNSKSGQARIPKRLDDAVEPGELSFKVRWGEATESDQIDTMLPSNRSKSSLQLAKRRQTKIANSIFHKQTTPLDSTDTSENPRHKRAQIRGSINSRRKPQFRPPKLSILDAPSLKKNAPDALPTFLKVASRAVRSRKDTGRHSPSRKYLRLATRDDDHDANETLRDWREGTIVPRVELSPKKHPSRHALFPRSANDAPAPHPRNTTLNLSDNSSRSSSNRHQAPGTKRKTEHPLDHFVQRTSSGPTESPTSRRETKDDSRKRKLLMSSLRGTDNSRPAMLETPRNDGNNVPTRSAFRQDLSRIDRFDDESGLPNVLRLFREDAGQEFHDMNARTSKRGLFRESKVQKATGESLSGKRKRLPQRMDVPALWSRASPIPITVDESPSMPNASHLPTGGALTNLGPFGTEYSDNFGIKPLPTGICFHESTFIGSGALSRSLRIDSSSDLDKSRGFALWHSEDRMFRWGPWNDCVSSELGEALSQVTQIDQVEEDHVTKISHDNASRTFTAILAYFSDHLSFIDPVDRVSCVQRCKGLISTVVLGLGQRNVSSRTGSADASYNPQPAPKLQLHMLVLALAGQISRIAQHELVPLQLQEDIRSIVKTVAQTLMGLATSQGFERFPSFLSQYKNADTPVYTLSNEEQPIQAFVVAQHVLMRGSNSWVDFWKMIKTDLPAVGEDNNVDVRPLEEAWKRIFTLLPFLGFDSYGILESARHQKLSCDSWPMIKELINPVLHLSLKNPKGQGPSFNAYCRALFRRCLHLIDSWGWQRCESIIGMLFDFFARNQLAHLRNEESHGSPDFLEHLARNPSLAATPRDRCFHVLLKIIGSGMIHMRRLYSEKKIRDIIWRLMPNHGRFHPKEEAVRQVDLDALQNHHDLLCTLYWASPPNCRPRLTAIRDLVQLERSHRQACHINIRAWLNLAKFQLSTAEPVDSLDAFNVWHSDLLMQILRQHHLARAEAEEQVRSAQHTEGLIISKELIESTIAQNQRQVEALLSDALVSLSLASEHAQSVQAANALVPASLTAVFGVFDAGKPQNGKVVTQTLDVLALLAAENFNGPPSNLPDCNDDSQDYGDWHVFEEDNDSLAVENFTSESPLQRFLVPLRHLRSNAFGSDTLPEDSLLQKIVEVWVSVAHVLVRSGNRSWNDYVDPFSSDSWSSLRDTEQTRKYTALFFATLIKKDETIYSKHTRLFLKIWMGSLVERESLLKYQHQLTGALLNVDSNGPLLKNLPFWKELATDRFVVSAANFSERRISLISSVLSNMRTSLEVMNMSSTDVTQLRQEYKDMLKHLMVVMKQNYQALGSGSVKGAYVNFVQTIVELLQQHTSTICPVDRFFTDSGAFPLPANDPTYVIGQLKNYALRLHESRTPKQLAVFLQSVSERAAVDGQQPYLVGQLHAAMSNAFEDSTPGKPTLRFFLVKAIVSAYIETACTHESSVCGWILALPFLQALQMVFDGLLLDLDGLNSNSVAAVSSILSTFLNSVSGSLDHLLSSTNSPNQPGILKLLSAIYSAITALLPTLDYLTRLRGPTDIALKNLQSLHNSARYLDVKLQGKDTEFDLTGENTSLRETAFTDARQFATQELKDSLSKNWTYVQHEQQYYFTRGASRREVLVDIGLFEEERADLVKELNDFFRMMARMPTLCYDEDDEPFRSRKENVPGWDQLVL